MRGVTWSRDSHGLFDYESKSVIKKSWSCADPARILRFENDISIEPLQNGAIFATSTQNNGSAPNVAGGVQQLNSKAAVTLAEEGEEKKE
jgi:hypothetical protein